MTSEQLYHVLGLQGYQMVATWYEQGRMMLEVESIDPLRCSQCGSRHVIRRGRFARDFRAPSIGDTPLLVRYAVARVECRCCGAVRQVKVEFAPGRRGYLKRFERMVLGLLQGRTILDAARWLKVS